MSICTHCGAEFSCGMVDAGVAPDQPCWCTSMPKVPAEALAASDVASCRCPACLKAWIEALAREPRGSNQGQDSLTEPKRQWLPRRRLR